MDEELPYCVHRLQIVKYLFSYVLTNMIVTKLDVDGVALMVYNGNVFKAASKILAADFEYNRQLGSTKTNVAKVDCFSVANEEVVFGGMAQMIASPVELESSLRVVGAAFTFARKLLLAPSLNTDEDFANAIKKIIEIFGDTRNFKFKANPNVKTSQVVADSVSSLESMLRFVNIHPGVTTDAFNFAFEYEESIQARPGTRRLLYPIKRMEKGHEYAAGTFAFWCGKTVNAVSVPAIAPNGLSSSLVVKIKKVLDQHDKTTVSDARRLEGERNIRERARKQIAEQAAVNDSD